MLQRTTTYQHRHGMFISFLNIIKQDTRLWHPHHEMAEVFFLLFVKIIKWMTIFIIKNGKIKISFILVFLNLSALFTYLFKLSWNHQLKYCTRLCKIHFMFHLCCWFSSAVTDKPMIMSDKSLIKSRKTIQKSH